MPARLFIHTTSAFDAAELEGFAASAEDMDITDLELIWVQLDRL